MNTQLSSLIEWIRSNTAGAKGLLVPVSGGTDSALCFWLCMQAFPSQSYPDKVVAVHFGETLPCREWFESIGKVESAALPDIIADVEKIRWGQLIAVAEHRRYWPVGSRNKTEEVLGTYSLASRLATVFPVIILWKTEVMDACRIIGVPEAIVTSSHQPDPACGRPATMSNIGITNVDIFLMVKEGQLPEKELKVLTPEEIEYLEGVYHKGQFKRRLPLCPPRF